MQQTFSILKILRDFTTNLGDFPKYVLIILLTLTLLYRQPTTVGRL